MNLQPARLVVFKIAPLQQDAADAQFLGYTATRLQGFLTALHAVQIVRKMLPMIRAARLNAALVATLAATLFFATGCTFFSKPPAAVVPAPVVAMAPAKPTALTANARSALILARNDITVATTRAALWPRATQLLKQAEAAAVEFDSSLVTKLAEEVSALCAASVKQASYMPVQIW